MSNPLLELQQKYSATPDNKFGVFNYVLLVIGIISIGVITLLAGIYAYTVFTDGTLISPVELVCGNQTNIQTCEKQDCTNQCNPQIKIEVNNTSCDFTEIKNLISSLNCSG